MPLIKATAPTASNARPFSMADIEAHARRMLLKARQDADQLLAAAQTEADKLIADAGVQVEQMVAQGLAQGKKEGLVQGKAEGVKVGKAEAFEAEKKRLTEALTTVQAVLNSVDEAHREVMERAESEALPLALAIARKVTKRMGSLDPRVVEANAREAVRLVTTRHDLRISANPVQKQLMEEISERLKLQWPQLKHIAIIEDAAISPGGCRVTTAGGEIDAELDSQLDRLARELIPEVKEEGANG